MQPILDRAAEDVAGVSCHIEMPQGRRHYCGPEMKFSAPPDAQGHAGVLTPEDAFVAAVNSCVMMMFIWATERFRLKLLSFECRTEGTKLIELDRTEIFTRLYFKPVIRIARGDESKQAVEARTRRALEAAQKYSLVENSVKSEIVMEPQIFVVELESSSAPECALSE
jgi:uncharacterized OsmC-like protein